MNIEGPIGAPPAPCEIVSAAWVGVVGSIFIGAMPAIVAGLTESGRLPPDQSGYIVAIDVAAQVGGAAAYLVCSSWTWRRRIAAGLIFMAAGNALSCYTDGFSTLALTRILAGMGVGIARAGCFNILAHTRRPARASGLFNVVQSLVIAAALAAFPGLTFHFGWRGPFLALSGLSLLSVATWWSWPMGRPGASAGNRSYRGLTGWDMVGLICVAIYFLGQASVWAFLAPIGRAMGQSYQTVSYIAAIAVVPGALASLISSFAAARIGTRTGLSVGLAMTIAALILLALAPLAPTYTPAVILFYFAWSATVPFQFSAIAEIGRSAGGSAAAAFPTADTLGIALGPALAGIALRSHGPKAIIILSALCSLAGILSLLPLVQVDSTAPVR